MNDDLRPAAIRGRRTRDAASFPAVWRSRSLGTRIREGVGAALLCAGLLLLPFLATLDMGVAIGCRDIGRPACLQMVSHSIALPIMDELGMPQ